MAKRYRLVRAYSRAADCPQRARAAALAVADGTHRPDAPLEAFLIHWRELGRTSYLPADFRLFA